MLKRLLAIKWDDDSVYEHTRSRTRLLREYLRRSAWWAQAVGATGEWPFFDIAAQVDPSVRADPAIVEGLAAIAAHIALPPVRTSCEAALHWAALRATPGVRLPELDDPFEPLLALYERGGAFTIEHGSLDVGLALVRRKSWQDHLVDDPVVAVDRAELDALDA